MDTLLSVGQEREEQAMFVTGDRVLIHSTSVYFQADNPSNPLVVEGTVTKITGSDNMNVKVIWDNGYRNVYNHEDLTLVHGLLWETE